jgi:hypothetical protein
MFVYREGSYFVAVPLLLREIDSLEEKQALVGRWFDATSVYGYAGPLVSHAELPAEFVERFRGQFIEALLDRGVVSVFSRLHPLLRQGQVLSELGDIELTGLTVSIDLIEGEEVQRSAYRSNHRRSLRKLALLGARVEVDSDLVHWKRFLEIYRETMNRVDATASYLFDDSYFERLMRVGGMRLLVCLLDGEVICAALFCLSHGIAQYHLGGTASQYLNIAPMKLLIDQASAWARRGEGGIMHLGGGVSSQDDSLFQFKAGFSERRHEFRTWRWVLNPGVYDELCNRRTVWAKERGLDVPSTRFFPAYRAPLRESASSDRVAEA